MRIKVAKTTSGRYYLSDQDSGLVLPHIYGMNILNTWPWNNWVGPVSLPGVKPKEDAWKRYYRSRKSRVLTTSAEDLWASEHTNLLKLAGINMIGMDVNPRLSVKAREEDIQTFLTILPRKTWRDKLKKDFSVTNGIQILRQGILDARSDYKKAGGNPDDIAVAVCDWNEPIWGMMGISFKADEMLKVFIPLFQECAKILKQEFPNALIGSPRLAGSLRQTHASSGWIGRMDKQGREIPPSSDKSHFWKLLKALAEIEEYDIVQYNAYGKRSKHKFDLLYETVKKPFHLSEWHYGLWSISYDIRRWFFNQFYHGGKPGYPKADPQTLDGLIENCHSDVLSDVNSKIILGASFYSWAVHGSDNENDDIDKPFGYAWGPIDPTRSSKDGKTEFRDLEWLELWEQINKTAQEKHRQLIL